MQPEDVSRDTAINFDTASTLHLSYENGVIITLENVGAATVLWTRARASVSTAAFNAPQDDAGREEARALANALNQRFDGWALRCLRLRQRNSSLPLLISTAKSALRRAL